MKLIKLGFNISAIIFLLISQISHAQKEIPLTGKISFEGAIVNESCSVTPEQKNIVMLCPASGSYPIGYPTEKKQTQVRGFNNQQISFEWINERKKFGTVIVTMH